MKEYVKPELELVSFATEYVALMSIVPGEDDGNL